MSFLQFPSMSKSNHSSTVRPLVELPSNLLEAFIPGYGTISRLLLETFGFDITLIGSISFFVFALIKSIEFLQAQIYTLVMRFGTCSIRMSSDVDSYFWMMDWLSDHSIGPYSYSLTALPMNRLGTWEILTGSEAQSAGRPLSITKGKLDQRYEPALGLYHYFWHRGRLFLWFRTRERQQLTTYDVDIPTSLIEGRLYCLSRSTEPLKALVEEASAQYRKKRATKTIIRRPAARQQRKEGGNPWKTVATRPSRPLETVVLSEKEKDHIISDIEEYLQPSTRRWYGERGIPYRRGYLFYGPPGTGKTSLSFAIAGVFRLEVYCVSLQDPTITEEDLVLLFDELPEKCLMLLEDIDSAGLVVRDQKVDAAWHTVQKDMDGKRASANQDLHPSASRISLSGLLNIIDGIASQEGRILIMTTNFIENLDSALLRPGRVDLRIEFDLATREQVHDIFLQIFSLDEVVGHNIGNDQLAEGCAGTNNKTNTDKIEELARAFAAGVPERTFSLAEIQGFLMNWKKRPADAVDKTKDWVEECSVREK